MAVTGQSSSLAIVIATLIIVAFVQPLHRRVQSFVDQVFYRSKIDTQQTILEFTREIRTIAKIEAGRVDIAHIPFVLRDWLQDLIRQTSGLAKQKDLSFEVVLDEKLPDTITGDPDHLMQVAINLVGNAIKFTQQGGVRIDVQVRSRGAWALIVRDTGIGINEEAIRYIFDRFRQVDSSSKREYGGTGLGLNIVRELILLMGGTIKVESQVGEGSAIQAGFNGYLTKPFQPSVIVGELERIVGTHR